MNTPPKLHVIGLTGGIACGKSTLREALARYSDVVTLDADKLGHLAYSPGTKTLSDLVDAFGRDIVADDGTVNRPKLGSIVFGDKTKLQVLNKIVWPAIRQLALDEMRRVEGKAAIFVLEAAVLIEAGWNDIVDEIWVVQTDFAKERLMSRNNMSDKDAQARIDSQKEIEQKRRESAHLIVNSDGPKDLVPRTAEELINNLRRRLCSLTSNGSELVGVVDTFNNVPQDVRKRAVVRAFNLPHRATYVVLLHEPSEKFIVQQRTLTKEYMPGRFDPCPGGVVDAGESYEANAQREMYEEMGLRISTIEPRGDFWFESTHTRCWGRLFFCRTKTDFKSGFVLQQSEVADIFLMTKEEILVTHRARMTPDGLYAFEHFALNEPRL